MVCTRCSEPLDPAAFTTEAFAPCRSCGAPLRVQVFPALYRAASAPAAEARNAAASESACFFHPRKKAVTVCQGCGRFVCALCDIDIDGRSLCPACIEAGRSEGRMERLENHRNLYDAIALYVALLPILFFPVTLVTAPMAIYLVIRHWSSPGSLVPRTRIRFVAAALIALAQLTGWGCFFCFRAG